MKQLPFPRTLLTCLSACAIHNTVLAASNGNQEKLANKIADTYLKAFSSSEIEKVSEKEPQANKKKKYKPTEQATIALSAHSKHRVVFHELFAKSSRYTAIEADTPTLLNPYAWNDLNLFCGSTANPGFNLMSRLNKTNTTLGEGALATLLATPVASIPELQKRQATLRCLLQEDQVYHDLKSQLADFSKAEEGLLSLWTPTDPLYANAYNTYMNNRFYTGKPKVDQRADSLQWRKIMKRDIWDIGMNFGFYPVLGVFLIETRTLFPNKSLNHKVLYREAFPYHKVLYREAFPFFIPGWNLIHTSKLIDSLKKKDVSRRQKISPLNYNLLYVYPGLGTLHSAWQYYKGCANYKEYAAVLRNLAQRMADVQQFIHTVHNMSETVANTPQLEASYGAHLASIRALLQLANEDTPMGSCIRNLRDMPLQSWSYFFNHSGKLLASHKLFTANKQQFHDALYEFGRLDAFMGIATLIRENSAQQMPSGYAFVSFLPRTEIKKPYLKIKAMWNPFLDASSAVVNDVEMDAAHGMRNMILTGPNAGGKSTFLTGVATSVLLSQTFGIAPAKEMLVTPFDKINTYIDVTDDIAAGKSLFMAEVDRFQGHIDILQQLKEDAFSFSIFDEPFSGTNPTEGAAAEYSILEHIANYSNALNIVATHYPIVMLLEKRAPQKGFRNYKVYIKERENKSNRIGYTYKVIPGKSNQAIAIDILEKQGYSTKMLERARDIIAHPEKYQQSF